MKEILKKYWWVIIILLLVPILVDWLIFGNRFPSNITNTEWAGFLGSYLGGVATLIAVFITINDGKKNLEEQKIQSIKPYLHTSYRFFEHTAEVGQYDCIFKIKKKQVEKIKYRFTDVEKRIIEVNNGKAQAQNVYIQYDVRNIGAGSAVEMNVRVNGFHGNGAIAKDQTESFYLAIDMDGLISNEIKIEIEYWDAERLGHYYQSDTLEIGVDDKGLHTVAIKDKVRQKNTDLVLDKTVSVEEAMNTK